MHFQWLCQSDDPARPLPGVDQFSAVAKPQYPFCRYTCSNPSVHQLYTGRPMLGSIALSVSLAVIVVGFAVVYLRGKRAAGSWHLLRDLSPVSSQWLADYRRGS